jgi:hypothetical protein
MSAVGKASLNNTAMGQSLIHGGPVTCIALSLKRHDLIIFITYICVKVQEDEMGGSCSTPEKDYTNFWPENLKVRDHSKHLGADVRIILEWILGKQGVKLWTGFIWLRMRTDRGLL